MWRAPCAAPAPGCCVGGRRGRCRRRSTPRGCSTCPAVAATAPRFPAHPADCACATQRFEHRAAPKCQAATLQGSCSKGMSRQPSEACAAGLIQHAQQAAQASVEHHMQPPPASSPRKRAPGSGGSRSTRACRTAGTARARVAPRCTRCTCAAPAPGTSSAGGGGM